MWSSKHKTVLVKENYTSPVIFLSVGKTSCSELKKVFSSLTCLPTSPHGTWQDHTWAASVDLCEKCSLTAKLSGPQAPHLQAHSFLCHTQTLKSNRLGLQCQSSLSFNFLICKMENLILSSLYRLMWEKHISHLVSQSATASPQQASSAIIYIILCFWALLTLL